MNPPLTGVVFDHTALLALGSGHRWLSGLVVAAHQVNGRHVYVPALCLAAASAIRPELGEHIGALPALEVIELGFAAALTVGRLVGQGVEWHVAHAVGAGRPDAEWPAGRPVLASSPEAYAGLGVAVIAIPPA